MTWGRVKEREGGREEEKGVLPGAAGLREQDLLANREFKLSYVTSL